MPVKIKHLLKVFSNPLPILQLTGWRRGSVVRMSVFGWRIFLIYAWSTVDMWPLCGYSVRYGSTNQANSAFHPFEVGKWVVIRVHGLREWRPLNGRPCCIWLLATCLDPWVRA